MPGNPLTDPNWAADLADTVERVVGNVRNRATTPVVHVTRGIVFGLLGAFLGVAAIILFLVGVTRGLQALLDLFVSPPQAVYLSYLIIGGILCLVGLLVLMRRQTPDA
jgi:cell division protein FtsX